ncbi:MAG: hypothetical protein GFH27_549395n4 [Chloroflexi bacterium AL-W]|nr:hypothetical protein [Chloroflexi bacterium AL-W]
MRGIVLTIITLTIGRIAVNMTRRFAYPFVPTIARQLDVTVPMVQSIVALQATSGIISPAFGVFAERYRRKSVMIMALCMMSVAAFVGAIAPHLGVFIVVMLVFGIGKVVYDPAMYAYVGDNVPYKRRGLALGVAELSWAGSLFLIAPIGGMLLARSDVGNITALMLRHAGAEHYAYLLSSSSGLQSVLMFLGVSCALGAALVLFFVQGYPPNTAFKAQGISPLAIWRVMRTSPAAMAGVAYAFLVAMSNEVLFINYGLFMEGRFALSIALLGSLTVIISVAEVGGELLVIGLSDRIGKRRMTLAGSLLATVAYCVIPFVPSLPFALGALFVLFIGVEVAIVASIPLFTEVLPENRVIMMSSVAGASGLGRVAGAACGGLLIALTGTFTAVGFFAAAVSALAFFMLWRYVPEG